MRFKKGSKVEVLSTEDVPSGCWRCAEIVSRNGRNYTVRYAGCSSISSETLGKSSIRPCPPLQGVPESWVAGDVVEVFEDFSWKMAVICKVFSEIYFLVRFFGSSDEYRVGKSSIRARLSWQDGRWAVIEEGFCGSSGSRHHDRKLTMKTSLKRARPYDYPQVEVYNTASRKFRSVEREGRILRLISESSDVHAERIRPSGAVGCSFAVNFVSRDEDSACCSVASCSITRNNPNNLSRNTDFMANISDHSSDAESYYQRDCREGNSSFPSKEDLAAEIHKLELHAYRCTMEALYASGPLSWDKEILVTNLRLSLHITNDEHLREVRNLVSADNSIAYR